MRFAHNSTTFSAKIFNKIFIVFFYFNHIQPKSPNESENHFTKKPPQNKMNQGMETLRQLATTSLFLQSEKNNISNHAPVVKIDTGK